MNKETKTREELSQEIEKLKALKATLSYKKDLKQIQHVTWDIESLLFEISMGD